MNFRENILFLNLKLKPYNQARLILRFDPKKMCTTYKTKTAIKKKIAKNFLLQ